MNLKKLFLIVCCTLPLFSFAEEKQIEVIPSHWGENARSLPFVPILTHNGE